jgi:hypothetical protein
MINGAGKQALKNGGPAVTNSFCHVRLPLLSLRSNALYRHKYSPAGGHDARCRALRRKNDRSRACPPVAETER